MPRYSLAAIALILIAAGAHADDKGTTTELGGLKSTTPANWKAEKAGGLRIYQFTIPKTDGEKHDTAVMVFSFPGGGGGVEANITRWKGMVKPAEGAKEEDTYKTSDFKVGETKVTLFEATGTYLYKKTPMDTESEPRPDHKFIGVIFESGKDTYYVRMVGPKKTMDANRKGFDEWIKGFK